MLAYAYYHDKPLKTTMAAPIFAYSLIYRGKCRSRFGLRRVNLKLVGIMTLISGNNEISNITILW